jgi:hypothetical protein
VTGFATKIVAFVHWICSSEELPTVPRGSSGMPARDRHGLSSSLLAGDVLGSNSSGESQTGHRQRFLKWLFAVERLPTLENEPRASTGHRGGLARYLLRPEELPRLGVAGHVAEPPQHHLSWLLSAEQCPQTPAPVSRRRQQRLPWLLSSEECPVENDPARRRNQGFLHWLSSRETCSRDGGPVVTRRTAFFRWLFTHEEL